MASGDRGALVDLTRQAGRVTVALAPLLMIVGAASAAIHEPDIETMLDALDVRPALAEDA